MYHEMITRTHVEDNEKTTSARAQNNRFQALLAANRLPFTVSPD